MYKIVFSCICITFLWSCKMEKKENLALIKDANIYHESVKAVSDVIVHDIFSPPVASRIYAYTCIGGYEVMRQSDPKYPSLAGAIKHMPPIPPCDPAHQCNYEMASALTLLNIGKTLIFSEDSIQVQIDKVIKYYNESGISDEMFENSISYADTVAAHILKWSSDDLYKQTRSYPKYSIQKDPSTWRPTPPGYMDGIEPSWHLIRTMLMDSAAQYKPAPPTTYDVKDKNSLYFRETMEVYTKVKEATEEEIEIANFWDCNPYKLNVSGHVMHATKKISPGGHWINIVGLTCKKSNSSTIVSAHAYAMVSVGLFDAFISCWDEKYRSNAIRPETVINEHIDPEWLPILQTPPFPEYTSGHSVASGAASVILTRLFGDNFSFDDDTEVEFGLPVRSFNSFTQAADEAAISRMYGGIHFMPAITNGLAQGRSVGQLVLTKLLDKSR
ncbi:MAG: vanadium-dependent haloperoxidase [Saprospiraceae bacterium]